MKPFSVRARSAVATACALAAGIVGSPAAHAAATAATAPAAPTVTAGRHVISKSQLPKNAVRYTGPAFTPGATGSTFPAATAPGSGSTRVVGGAPAQSGDFPGVVGIVTVFFLADPNGGLDEWTATCTGTAASPTQILTAAHCDTEMPFGTTYVIAGRDNLSDTTSGYVAAVRSTWTDQAYQVSSTGVPTDDVSVITLWNPLPAAYTDVSLTAQGDQTPYAAGTSATVVGYGETLAGNTSSAGTLNQATVPIQSDATCTAAMPGYAAATMTCAGDAAGGPDSCNGDSGGPLLVNGVEAGIVDWGSEACGSAGTYGVYERLSAYNSAITTAMAEPPIINMGFFGGGHPDIMAISGAGDLLLYNNSGFLNDGADGFAGVLDMGSGWGGLQQVFRVNNWNGDNTMSLMAVTQDGTLLEYQGDGQGDWANNGNPTEIGTGWNIFNDIMVVNNWEGDGHADLIGREANGDLLLYESNGEGGWVSQSGTLIGTGWGLFNSILTPGTWNGDGHQVLIGREANGDLLEYVSDGHGGWVSQTGTVIGTGWNMFSTFLTVGDWNGDGMMDMIGVTPSGTMLMYETNGKGQWITGQGIQIGSGWTYGQIF